MATGKELLQQILDEQHALKTEVAVVKTLLDGHNGYTGIIQHMGRLETIVTERNTECEQQCEARRTECEGKRDIIHARITSLGYKVWLLVGASAIVGGSTAYGVTEAVM